MLTVVGLFLMLHLVMFLGVQTFKTTLMEGFEKRAIVLPYLNVFAFSWKEAFSVSRLSTVASIAAES